MTESSQSLIVYGRPSCPSVPPVLRLLDAAGVAYEYVNVRQDYQAAERLRAITGGYESVPTLVFPDGRVLVEPGTIRLQKALKESGHDDEALDSPLVAVRAGLSNPVYFILALIALALAVAAWLSG